MQRKTTVLKKATCNKKSTYDNGMKDGTERNAPSFFIYNISNMLIFKKQNLFYIGFINFVKLIV